MTVYLLKNRSDDADLGRPDPYEESIEDVKFVPIMDYQSINLPQLTTLLEQTAGYDAIIVTSQRAVDALKPILSSDLEKEKDIILEKPVYTVGPTTAQRLKTLGFTDVRGSDAGTGVALAHKMLGEPEHSSPHRFLFVAGEVHRRELPNLLTESGHKVDTIVVYRTIANEATKEVLQSKVRAGDWIVFFSPSHTSQVLEFLRTETVSDVRIAAIGPTTQKFLEKENIAVDGTAPEPSAGGLKSIIS